MEMLPELREGGEAMSEYIVNFDGELGMALVIACAGAGFARKEIVRCRDCRHFMRGNSCSRQDEWNEFHWLDVEPDGFCAWALRVIVPTYPKDETFMACAVAVIANGANCEYGIPVRKVDNAD
jgi:hypothetical protein